jgi:hypothetical protein
MAFSAALLVVVTAVRSSSVVASAWANFA